MCIPFPSYTHTQPGLTDYSPSVSHHVAVCAFELCGVYHMVCAWRGVLDTPGQGYRRLSLAVPGVYCIIVT